jgi:hypothetical protein
MVASRTRDESSDASILRAPSNRPPGGAVSLLEGHTRATAMVLEGHRLPDGVDAYIGESPTIAGWAYL